MLKLFPYCKNIIRNDSEYMPAPSIALPGDIYKGKKNIWLNDSNSSISVIRFIKYGEIVILKP